MVVMRHIRLFILALLTCSFCLSGCVSYSLPELQVHAVKEYPIRAAIGGLSIAIDPYFDSKRMNELFGTDMLRNRIAPILVIIENHSNSMYLVEKSQFSVVCCLDIKSSLNGEIPKNAVITTMKEMDQDSNVGTSVGTRIAASVAVGHAFAYLATSTIAAPLFIAPGPFAGVMIPALSYAVYIGNKNIEIKRQVTALEITEKTIAPTDSLSGFIYLSIPNDKKTGVPDKLALDIRVKNINTGQLSVFILPLPSIRY